MKLDAVEFLRRFLQHVLPARFVRIRHYGFLANRARKQKLPLCRRLIGCVFGARGGQIALISHPAPVKSIFKDGRWTLDELLDIVPDTLAADLVNPAPPRHQ